MVDARDRVIAAARRFCASHTVTSALIEELSKAVCALDEIEGTWGAAEDIVRAAQEMKSRHEWSAAKAWSEVRALKVRLRELEDKASVADSLADRVADLRAWATSRIAECRRLEWKISEWIHGRDLRTLDQPQALIEVELCALMTERRTLEAVLRMLEEPKGENPCPQAWRDEEDAPIEEDEAIDAAFPTTSGRHDLYGEAMRLVGAKYSKAGLVALVNWLLHRIDASADEIRRLKEVLGQIADLGVRCAECEGTDAPFATHVTTCMNTGFQFFMCAEHAEETRQANRKAKSKGCGPQPEVKEHEQDTAVQIALRALGLDKKGPTDDRT